jgi:hypothetical protein
MMNQQTTPDHCKMGNDRAVIQRSLRLKARTHSAASYGAASQKGVKPKMTKLNKKLFKLSMGIKEERLIKIERYVNNKLNHQRSQTS